MVIIDVAILSLVLNLDPKSSTWWVSDYTNTSQVLSWIFLTCINQADPVKCCK